MYQRIILALLFMATASEAWANYEFRIHPGRDFLFSHLKQPDKTYGASLGFMNEKASFETSGISEENTISSRYLSQTWVPSDGSTIGHFVRLDFVDLSFNIPGIEEVSKGQSIDIFNGLSYQPSSWSLLSVGLSSHQLLMEAGPISRSKYSQLILFLRGDFNYEGYQFGLEIQSPQWRVVDDPTHKATGILFDVRTEFLSTAWARFATSYDLERSAGRQFRDAYRIMLEGGYEWQDLRGSLSLGTGTDRSRVEELATVNSIPRHTLGFSVETDRVGATFGAETYISRARKTIEGTTLTNNSQSFALTFKYKS